MKKAKKLPRDPRSDTPPGYFIPDADWLPENDNAASFFSLRDTMFFVVLIVSCVAVATILWMKPPKYVSFDANLEKKYDPAVAAKNVPMPLQMHPSYDQKRFEEIPDDDPSITGDESDLPLKEEETGEETLPHTIKSELKKVIHFLLASLRFRVDA